MWSQSSQRTIETEERDAEPSPAFQIVKLFHRHEGYQQGRSNIRTDHARQAILHTCIRYGVRFDKDDFTLIHGAGEWEYSIACGNERGILNPSAAQAYEKFKGRKPFLIEDEGTTTPTRIYVGRRFPWMGQDVECTSFSADGKSLTACSYKPRPSLRPDGTDDYSHKIDRRYTITIADIHEQRANRRKQTKEAKE